MTTWEQAQRNALRRLDGARGMANPVPMRPDVMVRDAGQLVGVAERKYKRLDAGVHRHHELYQGLAYCTALGVDRGFLVYPQHLAPVAKDITVRNAGVTLTEVSFDLGGNCDALLAACDALARQVLIGEGKKAEEDPRSSISSHAFSHGV